MKREIGGGIAYKVLIILGIVTAQEGKGPFTEISVDVFHLLAAFHFAHDHHVLLDQVAPETGGLSHETCDHSHVILRQHRRHWIVLGRELEESEVVSFSSFQNGIITGGIIYIRKLINKGISEEIKGKFRVKSKASELS